MIRPILFCLALAFSFLQPAAANNLDDPRLAFPILGDTVSNVDGFTFTEVEDATQYHLWLRDSTGTVVIKQWYNLSDLTCRNGFCRLSTFMPLVDGRTFWRIAALVQPDGPTGFYFISWSKIDEFMVDNANCF